jgi:hypothetical protein
MYSKKHDVSETGFWITWLRLALSKGPNWVGVFSPTFTWGRKQIQFPKHRIFWNTGRWKKSRKILWILQLLIIGSWWWSVAHYIHFRISVYQWCCTFICSRLYAFSSCYNFILCPFITFCIGLLPLNKSCFTNIVFQCHTVCEVFIIGSINIIGI